MRIEAISLVGSGGHALVVLDSLLELGVPAEAISILDQNPERAGLTVGGHKVAMLEPAALAGQHIHVCIGNNGARAKVMKLLTDAGCVAHTIVDPRAIVSRTATVGAGSFVAPGSIVASSAAVGRGCIINHGAIVDHECTLSDFVHIAPGVTLAGAVTVGHECLVGAGANILPRISIAAHAIIGAGAVLTRDATQPGVYVGAPARKV